MELYQVASMPCGLKTLGSDFFARFKNQTWASAVSIAKVLSCSNSGTPKAVNMLEQASISTSGCGCKNEEPVGTIKVAEKLL